MDTDIERYEIKTKGNYINKKNVNPNKQNIIFTNYKFAFIFSDSFLSK